MQRLVALSIQTPHPSISDIFIFSRQIFMLFIIFAVLLTNNEHMSIIDSDTFIQI